jgi:hypothetical protein
MSDTNEKDFGMLWSVAFIMLAITIGCVAVQYIDQQALVDYKIECALQDLEQKYFADQKASKSRPLARVEEAMPTGMIHSMVLQ